jgi:hypothetical protein
MYHIYYSRISRQLFILRSLILYFFCICLTVKTAIGQTPCSDPGGGHRFIDLTSGASARDFYPEALPSGQSGTDRSTAGYIFTAASASAAHAARSVTLRPVLANGTTGSTVLKFDRLGMPVAGASIEIFNGPLAIGSPALTINQANAASFIGTTVVYNGPATVRFTSTGGGSGNFDVYIKFLTGDQVITSCQGQQVAVWTEFMQPNSYTFVDDYGDPYAGNSAPVCIGYFNGDREFVSSEVSMCVDHSREVASVAFWFYPGQVIYSLAANTNHDIDRSGAYDAEDQLKIARVLWLLANAPSNTKPGQLSLQLAVWNIVDELALSGGNALTAQAIAAVPSLPSPAEPTFSITAPATSVTAGNPVTFTVNFDISGAHPSRLKLIVPSGVTIGTITGATYSGGFLNFSSLPASATIEATSATSQTANLQVAYEETNFWNLTNLEVYNACTIDPLVQDFVGISRRDNVYPYRAASATWDAVLPVPLVTFEANKSETSVKLTWSTSNESNSDHFDIQRSANGREWTRTVRKTGAGNSTSINNYTFTDISPIEGINYYHLKMVDRDATFAYSRIINVDVKGGESIYIYPNPTADLIRLSPALLSKVGKVEVLDVKGKIVYSAKHIPADGINVKGLITKGVYVVVLNYADGSISSHKILIAD